MRKNHIRHAALAFAALVFLSCPILARAQAEKASYPAMAPLDRYLIADEKAEIALARSAAPASVSDGAEVMVLRRAGYATAAKGTNGFVCLVERSWANTTDDAQFWNPQIRAPHCFNQAAAFRAVVENFSNREPLAARRLKADQFGLHAGRHIL